MSKEIQKNDKSADLNKNNGNLETKKIEVPPQSQGEPSQVVDLSPQLAEARRRLARKGMKDLRGRHKQNCKCGRPACSKFKVENGPMPELKTNVNLNAGEWAATTEKIEPNKPAEPPPSETVEPRPSGPVSSAASFTIPEPDKAEIDAIKEIIHIPFEMFADYQGIKNYKMSDDKKPKLAKGALQIAGVWLPGLVNTLDPKVLFTIGVGFSFGAEFLSIYRMKKDRDVTPQGEPSVHAHQTVKPTVHEVKPDVNNQMPPKKPYVTEEEMRSFEPEFMRSGDGVV